VRILLDTQCWLWMVNVPENFSTSARRQIRDSRNELILSSVCAMEISIKYSIGKLPLHIPPAEFIAELQDLGRVSVLPVDLSHAIRLAALPFHHKDPFDRLLIAQAQVENLPILTVDGRFKDYGIDIMPATSV